VERQTTLSLSNQFDASASEVHLPSSQNEQTKQMETQTPPDQIQEHDPYDVPAGSVDTSFPRLVPNKLYPLEVIEAEVRTNDEQRESLRIVLKTTEDAYSTTGDPVNKGFPVYHYVSLTPSDKYTHETIKKNLALIMQALGLVGMKISNFKQNPGLIVGKVVVVKLGLRKADDEYPESNKIVAWVPPA